MTDEWLNRLRSDPLLLAILNDLQESGIDLEDPKVIEETLPDAIRTSIPEAGGVLRKELRSRTSSMLCDWSSLRSGFESRLKATWSEPFELFQSLIAGCSETGDEFNREERATAVKEEDHVFEALTRIHGRGCQTAFEVQRLLEAGYANGAFARWRTLHELAVVAVFIAEQGRSTAERYLLHVVIASHSAMEQYEKHRERLGYEGIEPDEMTQLQMEKERLRERFGTPFGTEYGWAADALDNPQPTFAQIEAVVEMSHMRPFYKMASHGVHAGPKGLFFNMGVPSDIPDLILSGASNTGLADPAQWTARSLHQITAALIATRPTLERLIVVHTLGTICDEIAEASLRVQAEVEARPEEEPTVRYLLRRGAYWMRYLLCRVRRLGKRP